MSNVLEPDKVSQCVTPPPMWAVLFHNDDYTSFDAVIMILVEIFSYTVEKAEAFAQQVHEKGQGVVGVYTKDVAQTKQQMAISWANAHDMPLLLTLDPVDATHGQ